MWDRSWSVSYTHLDVYKRQLLLSVISDRELPRVEKLIHNIDPESFMVVSRVSEVRGRGFSMSKRYR